MRLSTGTMTANTLPQAALPIVMSLMQWWRGLGHARKLTAALSLGIVCATLAACSVVGQHIQELFANRAAASTALYMDSRRRAARAGTGAQTGSVRKNRSALEQLMSPASSGKPVVAFRIWLSRSDCLQQSR